MLAHNQDVKLFNAEQDDPATAMESAVQAAMNDEGQDRCPGGQRCHQEPGQRREDVGSVQHHKR